jgi:peptide/nickel transport system substrate-binding protein
MNKSRFGWKTGVIVITVMMVISLFVAACSPKPSSATETSTTSGAQNEEVTTLTIADALQPSSLDIATEYEAAAMAVNRVVYERLVRYSGDGTDIEPELATSWTISEDGKEYTFQLRQGVKFQDGTDFNGEAVKFSFDRVLKINQGPAWMFSVIDSINCPDEYTVTFVLKEPFSAFLPVLANIWGTGIVSPTAVTSNEVDGDSATTYMQDHMVGTGPYKFVEWVHGDHITLERNPDYWGGWTETDGKIIDRVVIKFITEAATQRLQLEKGDIDIAMNIAVDDIAAVSQEEGLVLVEKPSMMGTYVRFNLAKAPCDNAKFREAIRYAIDYDGIINGIMQGHAVQMQGPAAIGLPGHDDSLPVFAQDMDKARELLAESGVATPVTLQYVYETGQEDRRMVGELIQSNLAELGINVEITTMPWETLWGSVSAEDRTQTPDLVANGWWPDYADVEDYLYPMYYTTQAPPNSLNIGFYSNTEVDALLDQAMVETDDAVRNDLYKQAQQLIVADVASLDLYQKTMTIMMRDSVSGFVYNPIYTEAFNIYDMRIND